MIEFLAKMISPLLVPMGVSYADLVFYIDTMKWYLAAGFAALIIMILIMILARKAKKGKKAFIRWQSLIAFLAVVVVIINLVCYGPMQNTLSAFLNASKVELAEDTVAQSLATIQKIGEGGIVLLENKENTLPLQSEVKRLNVFGWASTKPYIGGTGSSASSAAAATDILTSLKEAGYEINETLVKLYTSYAEDRPAADMFGQNLTLPEPTQEAYTDDIINEAVSFSDTALIVIARGGGENYDLPTDMNAVIHGNYNIAEQVSIAPETYPYTKVTYQNNGDYDDFDVGESYLHLSNTEEKMIELVCEHFEHVIVLINACNPMELGWLQENDKIDAALLAPAPGVQGFKALGGILNGEINPSGRTADTFVYDLSKTPYINNIGINAYTNIGDLAQKILKEDKTYQGSASFVNYAEGIYVGYKYYETAAEEGTIDYAATVQYPFGYGLSYTTFEKSIEGFKLNQDTVTFTVNVKNTGKIAGRDVVEIYYSAPYTNGGIEKAAVNLIDFAKTGVIAPGRSEKINFTINTLDMASFDAEGIKSTGSYVLEAGEYIISVRSDAHTIDDKQSFIVANDRVIAGENRFEDYSRGDFVQLSRKDHFANYTVACASTISPDALIMNDATKNALEANTVAGYNGKTDADKEAEKPTMGSKGTLTLAQMTGLSYDDPKWDELLDQLTYKEMEKLVNAGGWGTQAVASVEKMATSDCDGPAGLNNFLTGSYGTTYPAEVLMAQTWDKNLAYEIGVSMGSEFASAENFGWYGPAMNLHRSAFSGRNFEYFSEDGVLSGIIASNEINGASLFGVYPYIKHLVLNDQELGRTSILLTYAGEQTIRENYLKPFELAIKYFTGKSMAVMSSYNWIGTIPSYCNSNLLNGILRDEWGFNGMVITDYDGSYGFMITEAAIRNGGDLMLGYGNYGSNKLNQKQNAILQALRRASKNILFTIANSGYYATETEETNVEQVNRMDELFSKINMTAVACLGCAEVLLVLSTVLGNKKRKKTVQAEK